VVSLAARWRRTWGERRPCRRRKITIRERVGILLVFLAHQETSEASIDAELVLPRLEGERLGLYAWRLSDCGLVITSCLGGKVLVALPDEREAN
jgi:hypothetical protein